MADRNLDSGRNFAKGVVYLDFSFLTNGASNPTAASMRGAVMATTGGGEIASIVYAATGKYTVTLRDKYRYLITKYCDLEDISTPDGAYASIGNVTNEGSSTTPPSFVVATWSGGAVATQYTGRRLSVSLVLKNSTVGV